MLTLDWQVNPQLAELLAQGLAGARGRRVVAGARTAAAGGRQQGRP
jgi:hypothetical protein